MSDAERNHDLEGSQEIFEFVSHYSLRLTVAQTLKTILWTCLTVPYLWDFLELDEECLFRHILRAGAFSDTTQE